MFFEEDPREPVNRPERDAEVVRNGVAERLDLLVRGAGPRYSSGRRRDNVTMAADPGGY